MSEQAIAEYGEMITQKESELAAAKEKEAKYYEAFCERVRSMEERGNVSYWSVIFNASSFSDLLDQVNAISEVMDYDNEIMDQLAKARQEVADAKTALEESKAAEETAKASLESQKADLQTEQAKVEATIQQITSQSSTYNSQMAKLENSQSNLANQIAQAEKQYQAQIAAQKAAEEAARQKAAKEAAEKAAAEAAAKKRQQEEEDSRTRTRITTVPVLLITALRAILPATTLRPAATAPPAATCGPCRGTRECPLPSATGTAPTTARSSTVAVTFPRPAVRPSGRPRAAWWSSLPMAPLTETTWSSRTAMGPVLCTPTSPSGLSLLARP